MGRKWEREKKLNQGIIFILDFFELILISCWVFHNHSMVYSLGFRGFGLFLSQMFDTHTISPNDLQTKLLFRMQFFHLFMFLCSNLYFRKTHFQIKMLSCLINSLHTTSWEIPIYWKKKKKEKGHNSSRIDTKESKSREKGKQRSRTLLVTYLLNKTHKAGPKAPWFVAIAL